MEVAEEIACCGGWPDGDVCGGGPSWQPEVAAIDSPGCLPLLSRSGLTPRNNVASPLDRGTCAALGHESSNEAVGVDEKVKVSGSQVPEIGN